MNTYRLGPGYGSNKLLIEFIHGPENESFFEELKEALQDFAIEIKAVDDLWMNDGTAYDAIFFNGTVHIFKRHLEFRIYYCGR